MTEKVMKGLTGIFGVACLGIGVSFVMTVVTAVQLHQQKNQIAPVSIPTPAVSQ